MSANKSVPANLAFVYQKKDFLIKSRVLTDLSDMESQPDDNRPNLVSLVNTIGQRDILEGEILSLQAQMRKLNVDPSEPLVDEEGYPRSDVDVATIRHIRHEIICKQNDCQELTKKIEEDLYTLHAQEQIVPNSSCLNAKDTYFKPFARVDVVTENSPAQQCDIRVGDLLIKFGNIKYKNFTKLADVSKFVADNVKRPIHVSVLRNNKVVPLIVIPLEWPGIGNLGCRIQPL